MTSRAASLQQRRATQLWFSFLLVILLFNKPALYSSTFNELFNGSLCYPSTSQAQLASKQPRSTDEWLGFLAVEFPTGSPAFVCCPTRECTKRRNFRPATPTNAARLPSLFGKCVFAQLCMQRNRVDKSWMVSLREYSLRHCDTANRTARHFLQRDDVAGEPMAGSPDFSLYQPKLYRSEESINVLRANSKDRAR